MSVSIILPTLNEESCLGEALRLLRAHRPHEIIVADGGSTDATCAMAVAADRLLQGVRGRAAQMNLGAAHATSYFFCTPIVVWSRGLCRPRSGAYGEAQRPVASG